MPDASGTPCVIYAARSVADDRDDAEKSTTSQTDEVRQRIEQEGSRHVVAEFAESGHSGYHGERGPELIAAMEAAKQAATEDGEAELWVFHSSRLSRGDGSKGRQGLMKIWADLRYEDVAVRSASDDEFVSNPMLVGIADVQNNKYSADHGAHVARGKDAAIKHSGNWPGGPVPDGYLANKVPNESGSKLVVELVPDPARSPVVEAAFALSEQGIGDPTIARKLNEAGHRTKTGKAWSRRSVQNMLRNHVYAGRVVKWGRGSRKGGTYVKLDVPEVYPGKHPPLIDPDRFDAIYAARAERDVMKGQRKASSAADKGRLGGRPTKRYALAKLAVCARCGERMYASTSPYVRKDGTQRRRYVCANVRFSTGTCNAPPIDGIKLDEAVVEYIERVFLDIEAWAAALTDAAGTQKSAAEAALSAAQGEAAELDKREAKMREVWTKAIEDGDTTRETQALKVIEATQEKRAAVQERADEADRKLAELDEAPPTTDTALDVFNELAQSVRSGDGSIADLNERLRREFVEFRLDTLEDGVIEAAPLLRERGLPDGVAAAYAKWVEEGEPTGTDEQHEEEKAREAAREGFMVTAEGAARPPVIPLSVIDGKLNNHHE